jgi:hypothetical protein
MAVSVLPSAVLLLGYVTPSGSTYARTVTWAVLRHALRRPFFIRLERQLRLLQHELDTAKSTAGPDQIGVRAALAVAPGAKKEEG